MFSQTEVKKRKSSWEKINKKTLLGQDHIARYLHMEVRLKKYFVTSMRA